MFIMYKMPIVFSHLVGQHHILVTADGYVTDIDVYNNNDVWHISRDSEINIIGKLSDDDWVDPPTINIVISGRDPSDGQGYMTLNRLGEAGFQVNMREEELRLVDGVIHQINNESVLPEWTEATCQYDDNIYDEPRVAATPMPKEKKPKKKTVEVNDRLGAILQRGKPLSKKKFNTLRNRVLNNENGYIEFPDYDKITEDLLSLIKTVEKLNARS